MPGPVVLAVASAACFLGLAHMAVTTPLTQFRRMTAAMAAFGVLIALVAPASGVALLAPVLLSRRLGGPRVPSTVPELLDRYSV
jgi:ABC-type transport system involved in cytochrome c biogenesis permease subunit